ncbi:hypothetical protein RhiirA4_500848 [Rhizophagus irregularis]|uniref:Uncharacterized protein n=1 Tax=Rhizophagus irregularis TaxID=588596 RepID=A0A2I1H5N4_9GLOM|nr:hypothetical protein RhiirA4_500848 [Rhizophagus irregularis]
MGSLLVTIVLVISYYFPNLEKKIARIVRNKTTSNYKRDYQGFVRKRIFFFTITFCIFHIFYEYYWFCTAPILGKFFNTLIVTILARLITSFFSEKEIKRVHKHNREDKIYAQIKPEDIGKVKMFYTKGIELKEYQVGFVKGHLYVYSTSKYYYVILVNNSAYFCHLRSVNDNNNQPDKILENIHELIQIDEMCLIHGCENLENKKEEIVNHSEDLIEISDHVLVNIIEIGILNYIVYSHRCSNQQEQNV